MQQDSDVLRHIITSGGGEYTVRWLGTQHDDADKAAAAEFMQSGDASDVLMVEGVNYSMGLNPEIQLGGEFAAAVTVAKQRGMDWCGVEDNDRIFIDKLAKKYGQLDVAAYLYFRELKVFVKQTNPGILSGPAKMLANAIKKTYADPEFAKHMNMVFGYYSLHDISQPEIVAKYSKILTDSGKSRDITELSAPVAGKYTTQKISRNMAKMRDQAIIHNIRAQLMHNNVLCILGKGHVNKISKSLT